MLILLLLVMNDLVSVLVSHKTFCIIQDGPEKHIDLQLVNFVLFQSICCRVALFVSQ